MSICYDKWFPETTRTLVAMGAEVILHPTMTDTIDRDVELAISRASAVTNQVYFFDINGSGDGGVGRSIIVDPSGYVLHQAGAGAEVMPVEVDFAKVRRERERGLRSNLGQPLKSFRDRDVDFTVYQRDSGVDSLPAHPGAADETDQLISHTPCLSRSHPARPRRGPLAHNGDKHEKENPKPPPAAIPIPSAGTAVSGRCAPTAGSAWWTIWVAWRP